MSYMSQTDTADDALVREVAKSKHVELTHDHGTTFQYSNRNYTTLGLLIKVTSGQSYEDYVQEHVLAPLGMNQSFAHLDDAKSHGLATGHQYWFNRPVPGGGLSENRAITPTGLMTASVEDMCSWLIVNLDHGDPGDFHFTMVMSPSTGWGVVLLMNGSNGQARLDIPAYGVMAQLVGVPIPDMPNSLTDFTTLIVLAALAIVVIQIVAIGRSIFVLRRWSIDPSRRPRTPLRKIIRLGVPVVISLLWAYICVEVLPHVLSLPFEALRLTDYGVLILLSLAIAVFWGVIIKPALGIWILQSSSGPIIQQAAPEPKVPIAAGLA